MDNRCNRLLVSDNDSAINMPAVGAAYAVKKYSAQASDELSFEVCFFAIFSLTTILINYGNLCKMFCKCFVNFFLLFSGIRVILKFCH